MTIDIAVKNAKVIGCEQMGDEVVKRI